jgi:hypothetical protein
MAGLHVVTRSSWQPHPSPEEPQNRMAVFDFPGDDQRARSGTDEDKGTGVNKTTPVPLSVTEGPT